MRTEYEDWIADIEGEKPKRSGWIIVAIASVVVLVGLVAIGNVHGG